MTDPISALSSLAAFASSPGGARASSFPAAAPAAADAGDLPSAVQAMSRHFDPQQTQIQFRIDHDAHRLVVSVVDAQSGALLIQIPSQDALAIAQSIQRTRAALVERTA